MAVIWRFVSWRAGLSMHLMGAGDLREAGSDVGRRGTAVLSGLTAKSALVLGDYGLPHALIPGLERSSPCSITGGTMP
jgi:hypothetical protein